MNHRSVRVLIIAGILAGCAGPVGDGGASPPAPPRPRELPLDRLDLCATLTPSQLMRLGVGAGKLGTVTSLTDARQFAACQWARFPQEPQDLYAIGSDLLRGVQYPSVDVAGVRVTEVVRYGAIEYEDMYSEPGKNCVLNVDVAAEQSLFVRYDYDGVTIPMTKELACDKAKVAAEMAIQTLIEQAGG